MASNCLTWSATTAADNVRQLSESHLAGEQDELGEHLASITSLEIRRQKGTHQHIGVDESAHVVIRKPTGRLPQSAERRA